MRSQDWKLGWENHSEKYLSLIGDERINNLQRAKVYVFPDSVLCLGKILENPQSNDAWEQRLGWSKSSSDYRNFDRLDGEPMEFEWNIFPRFNTLQLCGKVTMQQNVWQTPNSYFGMQEELEKDNGHSLVLVLKKVVFFQSRQSTRSMGQCGRKDVDWIR